MAGIDFELREPVHRSSCRVRYGDTDSGGVVYYANYLRYFEAGRTEYMRELVASYRDLEEQGFILPVVECHARYKAPARYDDLLVIETSLTELRPASCRFTYRISREDGKTLVLGSTTHAAVDRAGKLAKLPAALVARLRQLTEKREISG
ncbi:MAG: thioesterase family protein [Thermodesulfobacteriota bacterium]|jgi:acyl-CoA thioester hydrolase